MLKKSATTGDLIDLVVNRQMTMRYLDEASPEFKSTTTSRVGITTATMVLEHSLGFGNESFGLLYDAQGAKQPNTPAGSTATSTPPTASAIGAPAPSRFIFSHNVNTDGTLKANPTPVAVNSTNPWLEWGNRPFVSAEELLKVPAGSQATMLRMSAVVDPNSPIRANPYGVPPAAAQAKTPSFGTSAAPVENDCVGLRHASAVRHIGQHVRDFQRAGGLCHRCQRKCAAVSVRRTSIESSTTCRCRRGLSAPIRCSMPRRLTMCQAYGTDLPVVGSDITRPDRSAVCFQPPFNKFRASAIRAA